MDTGLVRDFVIIISGSLILILFLLILIIGLMLYREIINLTKTIKDTVNLAKETGNEVKRAVLNFNWIINLFKRGKGESSEINSQE